MPRHTSTVLLVCAISVGCGKSGEARDTATPASQQQVAANSATSTTSANSASVADSSSSDRYNAAGETATSGSSTPAGASVAEQDATKPPSDSRPLTDTEIAGVTDAANSSEIEQAKIAERKAKNPEVKRFAGMMLTHHQRAQTELAKLGIKKADSPVSIQLDTASASTVDLLKNSTGDFDRVYIDSQVEAHRNVIALIDAQLLPNAKEPSLRAYLQKIRVQVEAHLQQAEREQQALSATANLKHSGADLPKGKTVASSGSGSTH